MKIKGVEIKESYYKRSRPGKAPIRYTAQGYRSSGKVTDVDLKKDPALKRHPKLEKAMLKHEYDEIRLRSKGMEVGKAHRIARKKESKLIRNKSLRKLWEKMK